MKKIRFYIGQFLMQLGLSFMPIEADASIKYNITFLAKYKTRVLRNLLDRYR